MQTKDGTNISYQDWGSGQPIGFSHGWPLSSGHVAKITVPTLIAHGDDDQMVPIDATSTARVTVVRNATLKIYAGAPHGLAQTRPDEFNADLDSFIRAWSSAPGRKGPSIRA
jgi:pimeloyl-ACP methyl ester carboxylesterase